LYTSPLRAEVVQAGTKEAAAVATAGVVEDQDPGGTPTGNYQGVTVTVTINGVTQTINNLSVTVQ
jgi:hypothetical protein